MHVGKTPATRRVVCSEMLEVFEKVSFYLQDLIHIPRLTRQSWYYRATEQSRFSLYSFLNQMYSLGKWGDRTENFFGYGIKPDGGNLFPVPDTLNN